MADPIKRNAIWDWLFGAPLPGDESRAQQASPPPSWVFHARQSLLLLGVGLMTLGLFDADHRLPLVGPWLEGNDWGLMLLVGACFAGSYAVEWFHERRDGHRNE